MNTRMRQRGCDSHVEVPQASTSATENPMRRQDTGYSFSWWFMSYPQLNRKTSVFFMRKCSISVKFGMAYDICCWMWVQQCHKPPIWEWFIVYTTYSWWCGGMVYDSFTVLPTLPDDHSFLCNSSRWWVRSTFCVDRNDPWGERRGCYVNMATEGTSRWIFVILVSVAPKKIDSRWFRWFVVFIYSSRNCFCDFFRVPL
jgi:hypothetical protein